jgi:hypothetical protein
MVSRYVPYLLCALSFDLFVGPSLAYFRTGRIFNLGLRGGAESSSSSDCGISDHTLRAQYREMFWITPGDGLNLEVLVATTEEKQREQEQRVQIEKESLSTATRLWNKASNAVSQWFSQQASDKNKWVLGEAPPLIFLHGSFHGAWCWGGTLRSRLVLHVARTHFCMLRCRPASVK